MNHMSSDYKILSVIIALLFIASSVASTTRGLAWDESHHANAALFFYNFIGYQSENPELSISSIIEYAIDYHSRYKFLTVAAAYPPLNTIFLTLIYLIFGVSIFTTKIVSVIEFCFLIFFVFKLSELFYPKDKFFKFACTILVAVNPIIFLLSNSNFLAIGLTLFVISSSYFLIKFLRTDDYKFLYLFSFAFALGILQKPVMGLMALPFAFVFLRNRKIFLKSFTRFSKSILIFIITLIPLIIQLFALYELGFSDIFFDHWFRENDQTIFLIMPLFTTFQLSNILSITSNLFSLYFTLPLFLIGFYKSLKRHWEIDELFIASLTVFVYIFTISNFIAESRYISPILPFFIIIWIYGSYNLFSRLKNNRYLKPFKKYRLKIILLSLIIAISILQAIDYNYNNPYYNNPSLKDVALYVIADSNKSGTVLTTFGQPQMFEFAMRQNENNFYFMYMPQFKDYIPYAISGNFSYYHSYEIWKNLGIKMPPAEYIIFHEGVFDIQYDYNNSYFTSRPETFKLLKIIENARGDKIFIYKINLNKTI